jgi:hypothetical protein
MTAPAPKLRIGTIQATMGRNLGENGNGYSRKLTRGYKADDLFRSAPLGFRGEALPGMGPTTTASRTTQERSTRRSAGWRRSTCTSCMAER